MIKRERDMQPIPNFDNLHKLEHDTIFEVTSSGGNITDAGIKAIDRMLENATARTTNEWKTMYREAPRGDDAWYEWEKRLLKNFDARRLADEVYNAFYYGVVIDDAFDRAWVVNTGTYVGTFPKRVAKMAKKRFDLKMPTSVLQDIGNIAKANTNAASTRYIDFTKDLDWDEGDFGDDGSCYWGGREQARKLISDNGGGAIRLWNHSYNDEYVGRGRCWYAFKNNSIIIWNAYGPPEMQLIGYARIIATAMGVSYRRIGLSNNDTDGGLLWINGGMGYAIGKPEVVDELSDIDLNWDDDDYTEGTSCNACGDHIPEDDTRWYMDDPYCQTCWDDRFTSCERCDRDIPNDDSYNVEDNTWCERCYERYSGQCESCEDQFQSDSLNTLEMDDGSSLVVCDYCRNDNYEYCEACNTWHKTKFLHECPEDDTPAEPDEETISIAPYNDNHQWHIVLPEAYKDLLDETLEWCTACRDYHIRGIDAYNQDEAYEKLGKALRVAFGYPEHDEFIVNPGFEPWVIQGTETGRI